MCHGWLSWLSLLSWLVNNRNVKHKASLLSTLRSRLLRRTGVKTAPDKMQGKQALGFRHPRLPAGFRFLFLNTKVLNPAIVSGISRLDLKYLRCSTGRGSGSSFKQTHRALGLRFEAGGERKTAALQYEGFHVLNKYRGFKA